MCIHHSHSLEGKGEVRDSGRAGGLNSSTANIVLAGYTPEQIERPPHSLRIHKSSGEREVEGGKGGKEKGERRAGEGEERG